MEIPEEYIKESQKRIEDSKKMEMKKLSFLSNPQYLKQQ